MTSPSWVSATATTPPAPGGSGFQATAVRAAAGPATAPSAIQRSSRPSCGGESGLAPTLLSAGGMKSSCRCAARRKSTLSAGFPATTAGPESPPFWIAATVSRTSPPSWIFWL